MVFAAPCALLPNAFFDAVTIIFAFTVTIFLFFRCGGLCAAHGINKFERGGFLSVKLLEHGGFLSVHGFRQRGRFPLAWIIFVCVDV